MPVELLAHSVAAPPPSPRPTDVRAEAWFGHREAGRRTIRETSIRVTGDFRLTLVWCKDERGR